ncbi:unnamed protein product [Danaus chrysippus]|uniref:(African queen) hypothetical protein n=1 Tax=Danaus chrysippus TaxID=151541 RepID=A0A8J2R3I2_9NEOP|nr:unnamed protein product [Danaus chrysippus]
MKQYVSYFGVPSRLVTDRGTSFTSKTFISTTQKSPSELLFGFNSRTEDKFSEVINDTINRIPVEELDELRRERKKKEQQVEEIANYNKHSKTAIQNKEGDLVRVERQNHGANEKKGTRTQEVGEESRKLAIDDVIRYRKAALKYNIKSSTLESRVKKFKDNTDGPSRTFHSKFTSPQVFSLEEENRLNDYIINCCKMHYGLTTVQIRKLAYEYAKASNLKNPTKWDENQMDCLEWMRIKKV